MMELGYPILIQVHADGILTSSGGFQDTISGTTSDVHDNVSTLPTDSCPFLTDRRSYQRRKRAHGCLIDVLHLVCNQ